MEEIGPGKLVRLKGGEQYIIGARKVTRQPESGTEDVPHHFYIAIACGTSDLEGDLNKINKKDIQYTIVEMWEEQNPDTGEPEVMMRENTSDDAVLAELFELDKLE